MRVTQESSTYIPSQFAYERIINTFSMLSQILISTRYLVSICAYAADVTTSLMSLMSVLIGMMKF